MSRPATGQREKAREQADRCPDGEGSGRRQANARMERARADRGRSSRIGGEPSQAWERTGWETRSESRAGFRRRA
uniref:Uncharacterized protein n=1 Tax=Sphaerodactylus townsendi TaxID=933632 RepID=A0ACB8EN85_9SAUR